MTKKSKLIDNRLQSTGKVVRAVTTHSSEAAKALATLATEAEGQNTAANEQFFVTLFQFTANVLGFRAKQLDNAELAVVGERSDDVDLRALRDSLEAQLRAMLVRMRSNISDSIGATGLQTYGFGQPVPDTAYALASYGENASILLAQKPFAISVDGVTYDGALMGQALGAKAAAFRQSLVELEKEAQELVNELGKRDAMVELWADGYQGAADIATGLYRLIGKKHLADRVRPTIRTLSGEEVAPEVDENAPAPEPEPEPSGAEEPDKG